MGNEVVREIRNYRKNFICDIVSHALHTLATEAVECCVCMCKQRAGPCLLVYSINTQY